MLTRSLCGSCRGARPVLAAVVHRRQMAQVGLLHHPQAAPVVQAKCMRRVVDLRRQISPGLSPRAQLQVQPVPALAAVQLAVQTAARMLLPPRSRAVRWAAVKRQEEGRKKCSQWIRGLQCYPLQR